MNVHLIFGGPGTGKTTFLADIFSESVKMYGANSVRFVSFTRAQVNRDRKKAAEVLPSHLLGGFSTLHSASAKSYGEGPTDIIDRFELHNMSNFLGVNMEAVVKGYDYMKSTGKDWGAGANKAGMSVRDFKKYVAFYNEIKAAKSETKRTVDFSDMLEHSIQTKFTLDCKVAIVDEAQDLNRLQWQTIWTLFKNAEHLYVAGDPNQAIYGFSGSLPNYMNEMRFNTMMFLDSSRRCSDAVMKAGYMAVRRIDGHKDPPSSNGAKDGFAVYSPSTDLHELYFDAVKSAVNHGKSVLFLAYTYEQLVKVENALFYPKGRKYYPHNGKLIQPIPYSFLSGREKVIKRSKGKDLVTLSTIHQAKGMEVDYVFINVSSGQGGNKTYLELGDYMNLQDEYDRCLYVAITRARTGVVFFEMTPHRRDEPYLADIFLMNIGKPFYDLLVKHKLDRRVRKKLSKAQPDNTSSASPSREQEKKSAGHSRARQNESSRSKPNARHNAPDTAEGVSLPF